MIPKEQHLNQIHLYKFHIIKLIDPIILISFEVGLTAKQRHKQLNNFNTGSFRPF